jgi:hypothetical protein
MLSRLSLTLLAFILFGSQPTEAAPIKVENFALIDHQGKFHEFDYYRRDPNVKALVLFVQGNGCPLVRERILELIDLRDTFQPHGILFGMINANPQDERDDIAKEAHEFGIDIPILKDSRQLVTGMLGITRTAEAILIDTQARRIIFRGPIDDRLSYQSAKAQASAHYLTDAIKAHLSGKEITTPKIEAPGCRITFKTPDENSISYREHVAPILKNRCVQCHTKGGVGPFAMSNYGKVDGWSEMIAEVILTQQMPPWHADPHIGKFSNSGGVTDDEARTLVTWIRAGSPRGDGPDPLENDQPKQPEWVLGDPDKVIELPLQKIPAEGILEYRYVYLDSPFDHDVWVRAAELNPGNKKVLHHAIVTTEDKAAPKKRGLKGQWVTGYAPGTDPTPCPDGTGVLLRKGHRLNIELHYTVTGKPEEDLTRIGLHLLDKAPAKTLVTSALAFHKFRIPPHAREHPQTVTKKIDDNILLYGINPHMHFRGKRMSFTIKKPDGSKQILLSVPNYNFNWQRTYHFETPIAVAAGSELIVENAWDNSALNLYNPDPSKTVGWGDQTFDEMFFATFTFVKQ